MFSDHEMSFISLHTAGIEMQNSAMSATKGSCNFTKIFKHVNKVISSRPYFVSSYEEIHCKLSQKWRPSCQRQCLGVDTSWKHYSADIQATTERIFHEFRQLLPAKSEMICLRFFHNCFIPPPYQLAIYFSTDTRKRPKFMAEYTRVGTLIVATIYLQLIQNRYMFRSFTVLQCSHQHCVQRVTSDVEVVGYL